MSNKPKVSQYGSVDPAPPIMHGEINDWESSLTDSNIPMFQRMRNVFSLRNDGTDAACIALCSGFNSNSALLRHEVAYVLGQMQNQVARYLNGAHKQIEGMYKMIDKVQDRNLAGSDPMGGM